eukprot:scaffold41421_cov36-Tisochrysis_lutea.AAC.3
MQAPACVSNAKGDLIQSGTLQEEERRQAAVRAGARAGRSALQRNSPRSSRAADGGARRPPVLLGLRAAWRTPRAPERRCLAG